MTRRFSIVVAAAVVVMAPGCDLFLPGLPGGKTPSDPIGSNFDTATSLTLDADGNALITGTIAIGAPNVYDLGPAAPGDRIIVTVDPAAGSLLDPTAGVFDTNGELLALNDDADLASGLLGSRIDEVVWLASEHYYLVVSKFFLDSQGGAYQGTVRIERGGSVTPPEVQYLLLNFAGGTATIPQDGVYELSPFDAAGINATYAGSTDEVKAKIEEIVRQDFRNTGLIVITSDDPLPEPCTYSTIHFGGFSATRFGLAESVDQGNRDRCDDGIIFTDQMVGDTGRPFAEQPTVEGVGVAIGNVAAHEAGHLLGLNHVADVTALMDDTGTASTLLEDQEFKTAPLSSSVFPLGMQNAPVLLERVVPK